MDFELNEDQKMLAKTVASFAKQTSPVERARKMRDDERGWDPAVWKQMGELGWLSVPFPESMGGFGGTFVDVAVVLEKLGTTLVPEPYLPSVVLAGMAILRGGDEAQHKELLAPMIEGKTSLALAYAERTSRHDVNAIDTKAEKSGDGYRITGEKAFVLNGHAADHVVVSAKLDGKTSLFVVDREASGVNVSPIKTIDGRHAAMIRFDGVEVVANRLLAGDGSEVLERVLDYGAAAACAEGLGVVSVLLDMTTQYLKEREQFGVPIGSFQALQHRTVDMFVEQQLCVAMNVLAAVRADEDDAEIRRRDISAAKAHLATGGKFVAQQAIQLHGGIGITDEHDVGLYFKRLYALNALFGDGEHHVERFMTGPSFTSVM
jgi:alkylation response protein AidB-like acyl-CoA dehydrogenase